MMKRFFISYAWTSVAGTGFGNCTASPEKGEKLTVKDIRSIESDVASRMPPNSKVAIISIVEIAAE
nr:MAG TPA: protein of unknown function DUF4969 [Caudoviricetes sp.]